MQLSALPYHKKVKDHLMQQTKVWAYYANAHTHENGMAAFKTELLKTTYKFDTVSDQHLFNKVDTVKEKLGLQHIAVHIYQEENAGEPNAAISFFKNEAHIVFSGRVVQLLNDDELLCLLAHELAHVKLYTLEDSALEIADRIITSIANHQTQQPSYFETARLFKLYTEIFCDRCAYLVLHDAGVIVSTLVKMSTGLEKINPQSFIKQADEILSSERGSRTERNSHPENFIRAKAIDLWHRKQQLAEEEITNMIEGNKTLDSLDIFAQQQLTELTRNLLQNYLQPHWFQTDTTLSLAQQYFPGVSINRTNTIDKKLKSDIAGLHQSIRNYIAYVLLDFTLADAGLENIAAGRGFYFADEINVKAEYETAVKSELKLTDKKLLQYRERMLADYHQVKENKPVDK